MDTSILTGFLISNISYSGNSALQKCWKTCRECNGPARAHCTACLLVIGSGTTCFPTISHPTSLLCNFETLDVGWKKEAQRMLNIDLFDLQCFSGHGDWVLQGSFCQRVSWRDFSVLSVLISAIDTHPACRHPQFLEFLLCLVLRLFKEPIISIITILTQRNISLEQPHCCLYPSFATLSIESN